MFRVVLSIDFVFHLMLTTIGTRFFSFEYIGAKQLQKVVFRFNYV